MKLKKYLGDNIPLILLISFGICCVEILLLHYDIGIWMRILLPVIILSCLSAALGFDYYRRSHYYNSLLASLDALEDKYLVHALIHEGEFTDAKLLDEILYTTGKSMTENVGRARKEQEEYKEYMELWVHDIKLPIAAAKLVAENNPGPVSESMDEELDKIDAMTENVLYYARSECVEKDYIIRRCNLKELVGASVRANKKYLIRSHFSINIRNCDIQVLTDPKWASFILNQIISNSIKYSSSKPSLTFSASKGQEGLSLSVSDNGIGISADELGRIFEKGFTGSGGRNEGSRSTGIGLYLCRKLCGKLGMGIRASSEPGKGTEITIVFPKESFFMQE